jgi:hypothetical protein
MDYFPSLLKATNINTNLNIIYNSKYQMERKMVRSSIMSRWRCEENGVEIENRRRFEIEHNIKKLLCG